MVEVPAHSCPRCGSDDVERVRRGRTLDRLASLVGWRVYRCIVCGTRFYDRPLRRRAYRTS